MSFFTSTQAVLNKTLKDIKKVSFIAYIVVQIIFLILYAYKIYTNIDATIYLVIYCVLAFVSIASFIFYLVTYKNKKHKAIRYTKRGIRIFKYLANFTMIVVTIVEYAINGATEVGIILTLISIVSFIIQILIECIRIAYEYYAKLFKIAFEKDMEALNPILKPKETMLEKINNTAKKLAKITETKEVSKEEQYVNELTSEYNEVQKQKTLEKDKTRKQLRKEKRAEIRLNIKQIFHKKKEEQ